MVTLIIAIVVANKDRPECQKYEICHYNALNFQVDQIYSDNFRCIFDSIRNGWYSSNGDIGFKVKITYFIFSNNQSSEMEKIEND